MQRGLVTIKLAVCLSVDRSVKRVICDKTNETCAHFLYHMKHHLSYSFVRRGTVDGATLST